MTELLLVKTGESLRPMPEAEEEFAKLGDGEIIRAKYTRPNNLAFHRKVMALLQLGFENQSHYATFNQFRTAVLIGLGWCETFISMSGEVWYIPHSMSFGRMDQSEREKLYDDILNHLVAEHLGGDPRSWDAEVSRLVGFM